MVGVVALRSISVLLDHVNPNEETEVPETPKETGFIPMPVNDWDYDSTPDFQKPDAATKAYIAKHGLPKLPSETAKTDD
jgi:hypothetical protein